jgi:hypothetical protein
MTKILTLVFVLAVSACATERTTGTIAEYAMSGYVHAGPTCPVVQDPPDPECADRPVAAQLLVQDGAETIGEIRSAADGHFTTQLPAGTYTLVPQPVEGLMGTAEAQSFTVGPAVSPELDIAYDTGIR